MDKCGIYKITNLKNNRIYIGQSIHINQRWNAHKQQAFNLPNNKEYNYPLYCAMRKYGLESFIFEIEEECEPEKLNEREIFYIQKYNSYLDGYNQTPGGDNPPYSGIGTCQWDLNGNLIKKWPSGNAAAIALGVSRNSIYEVINGLRKTCCNCIWTRDDGSKPSMDLTKIVCPVKQYDLQGNFIAEYENAAVAERTILKDASRNGLEIRNACKLKIKTAFGFQWRNAHEAPPGKITRKIVVQYDLEGNIIKEWNSLSEAAKELHCSQGTLWSACNKKRRTAYGYIWKYKE